jgi:hypothetical protein
MWCEGATCSSGLGCVMPACGPAPSCGAWVKHHTTHTATTHDAHTLTKRARMCTGSSL